jgi:hypothetical protein
MVKGTAIPVQIIIGAVEEKTKPQIYSTRRREVACLGALSRPIYLSKDR